MTFFRRSLILIILIFIGCSSDDSNETSVNNGFIIDGEFYETNHAAISKVTRASQNSLPSVEIELFSNFDLDYFSSFFLLPDDTDGDRKLITGTYNTNAGNITSNIPRTVDSKIIQFRNNISFSNLFYSEGSNNSGTVTINSITNILDENDRYVTTEIDIDYQFTTSDGDEVIGNFNGQVEFSDSSEVLN
ncbi:hypothetical protein [Winogradskyella costae]|uniref:hypothetical protein n=1 Tax=Winogradskyella costae TaxID=2697008 RepID=UPI0015C96197|nr:hypothetical protein [Winogradskyella costae]